MATQLVTREPRTEDREKRQTIQKIAGSSILQGSEALCHLLRYLAEHALELPNGPIKEYQIATEVFGRSADFDPRIDSTVRVQTSRLRAKLAEYYASVGASDAWQVEIPKGSYALLFHSRIAPEREPEPQPAAVPEAKPTPIKAERSSPLMSLLPWVVACLASLSLVLVLIRRDARPFPPVPAATPALNQFWAAATPHKEPPLVVFSNAEFVGSPETGMRYRDPAQDSESLKVLDRYTGVGEVIAVHELDQMFASLGRKFILKRSRLLNWDDTKGRDLIFVGSPSENLALRDLPLNRDFTFERSTQTPRAGDLGIHNLHPNPGELGWYFGPAQAVVSEDYGLIEIANGADSSQRVLLVAGTTTLGTQGIAEFICREDKMADLLKRAQINSSKGFNRMSVVVRIKIQHGVPLDTEAIAFRKE